MNKEREERVRKAFDGKPLPYLMEGLLALETYGDRSHEDFRELVALMNELILTQVTHK